MAATARDISSLDDLVRQYGDALLPIRLDVTDRDADFAAAKQSHDHFGRLDIVVNNAGYGQFGFIEEVSERDARDQIETNVFGALWITQAALPYLRAQRSGAHHTPGDPSASAQALLKVVDAEEPPLRVSSLRRRWRQPRPTSSGSRWPSRLRARHPIRRTGG